MKNFRILVLALFSIILVSCQPDNALNDNGLTAANVDASFTIQPVTGSPNRFTLVANSNTLVMNKWDYGNGYADGTNAQTVFLPDSGTYTIFHKAIGRGGSEAINSQNFTVATSDPNAGNLVRGGRFMNAVDHAFWTVLNIASPSNLTFNAGNVTYNASNYGQKGIYQSFQVQANKQYRLDMKVTGPSCSNTWFEAYLSPVQPTQNSDYNSLGRRMGMSTWDGCANSPFSGLLSSVGCVGSGNVVSFPTAGTIYLTIKSGGLAIGAGGIQLTNVSFRGI